MTGLDWLITLGVNGAIVVAGLVMARGTLKASDWFLAGRTLPWWIVGLSMFATAVDSGDYVAVVGGAYTFGLSNLTTWWLGLPIGWFIVAYIVFLPMYRAGLFTNAEYLEYRFGPVTRVLSAMIQIQYRTNVLGNIAFSLFLTFSVLTGWGSGTWWLVVGIAIAAAYYTASGGLRSVAATDAIQSIFMFAAALVLWLAVWSAAGGWGGLEQRFHAEDPALAARMLHVGGQSEPGVPAPLVLFGWIVVLTTYCVVNHTQAMRMLGSRSEWDIKMAAFVASVVTAVVMWFNITLGILGRALYPGIAAVDRIFPLLIRDYMGPGMVGLVVAGLLAGGVSTFDSIGSSLSAVFTRDIYARFFARRKSDQHYLGISRIFTFVMIGISFLYIPYLRGGMMAFYLRITSVAVMPLFAVYMMGALTHVHRRSGTIGLAAGVLYGLSSLLGDSFDWPLPVWWTNTWWAYVWSIVIPAAAMLACTWLWGWAAEDELRGLVYSFRGAKPRGDYDSGPRPISSLAGTWLDAARGELPPIKTYPFAVGPSGPRWYLRPALWMGLFLAAAGFTNLVILW